MHGGVALAAGGEHGLGLFLCDYLERDGGLDVVRVASNGPVGFPRVSALLRVLRGQQADNAVCPCLALPAESQVGTRYFFLVVGVRVEPGLVGSLSFPPYLAVAAHVGRLIERQAYGPCIRHILHRHIVAAIGVGHEPAYVEAAYEVGRRALFKVGRYPAQLFVERRAGGARAGVIDCVHIVRMGGGYVLRRGERAALAAGHAEGGYGQHRGQQQPEAYVGLCLHTLVVLMGHSFIMQMR